jgi:hypothetical protein
VWRQAAPQEKLYGYRARVMREDRGRFARVRDARVLLYWPHGLGDWVQLAYVLPLLEPSNRYYITRYGDDFVALMEGNAAITPLYSGVAQTRNAFGSAARDFHLGVSYAELDGSVREVRLNEPLHAAARDAEIDVILWTDFPEVVGRSAFPFHTKARFLAKQLVAPRRLAEFALDRPLPTSLDVNPPADARALVEQRLADWCGPAQRLCVIAGSGHTAAGKNWGASGGEADRLAELLNARDERWRFLVLADESRGEHAATFAELFGDAPLPYANLLKAIGARAELFVGVPAGPFHFAVARGGVRCVGVWLAHHPYFYDEPSPLVRHVVGSRVRERGFDRRKGIVTVPRGFGDALTYLATPGASAEDVLAALDA